MAELAGARLLRSTERHSCCGDDWLSATVFDQNASRFWLRKIRYARRCVCLQAFTITLMSTTTTNSGILHVIKSSSVSSRQMHLSWALTDAGTDILVLHGVRIKPPMLKRLVLKVNWSRCGQRWYYTSQTSNRRCCSWKESAIPSICHKIIKCFQFGVICTMCT